MDPKSIAKAESRLRVASKALQELADCKSHQEFSDTWYTFLVASKNIWTSLEQGAKSSAQSRQWFGAKRQIRKSDPLLQYLFQARNDDEHGVEPITKFDPGGLAVGVAKPGFSNKMSLDVVFKDNAQHITVTPHDGKPVLIEETLPHTKLSSVEGRGGVILKPPTEHLGTSIGNILPINVGRIGLTYLAALIEEAKGLS